MSFYDDKITINEEADSDNLSVSLLGSLNYDFNEDINLDMNITTDDYDFNR